MLTWLSIEASVGSTVVVAVVVITMTRTGGGGHGSGRRIENMKMYFIDRNHMLLRYLVGMLVVLLLLTMAVTVALV